MYTILHIDLLLLTLDTLLDSTSTEGQGLDLPGSLLVSVRTFHTTYATRKGFRHHDGLRSMPIGVIALDERRSIIDLIPYLVKRPYRPKIFRRFFSTIFGITFSFWFRGVYYPTTLD